MVACFLPYGWSATARTLADPLLRGDFVVTAL
jgi:hypothetical protein